MYRVNSLCLTHYLVYFYSHKDSHSTEDEGDEDTYFGPDSPSITLEPRHSGTNETSCKTYPAIHEDPENCEGQQESTDSYIDVVMIDMTNLELQPTQNKTESDELSVTTEIILQANLQEPTEGNELEGMVLSEESVAGEKGEEESEAKETEEKIIKGESCMESEHTEREINYDGFTNQVDVDKMENKVDMFPHEEQTYFENKMKEIDVEKQKEGSDGGEGNDQQIEEDDIEEEIEAQYDSDLEGAAEPKEGSIPEELSEEDDKLSEDGTEQQSEKEKDSMREENHENPSTSDRKKPLTPSRMKERPERKGAELGLGMGRTVIISKHKIYQVRAVPVVPPKPQHSKITAFKQQFQQRDSERQQKPIQPTCTERQHTDRELPKKETENDTNRHAEIGDVAQNHDYHTTEQEKGTGQQGGKEMAEENEADQAKKQLTDTKLYSGLEGETEQDNEEQKPRRGTWDGGRLRKDGQKELDREAKRSSGISMCFDEAVARATGKRYREKESMEKDRFADLQWERSEQKEGLNQKKKEEEEEKTD